MKIGQLLIVAGIFLVGIIVGVLINSQFSKGWDNKRVLSTAPNQITITPPENPSPVALVGAKVVKIIDGDTIVLESGETVRLIGIDAPEKKDCFAQRSSQEIKRLIDGKEVRLEKDVSETDRYQRLLRYIWLNQTLINDELVRRGFAKAYPYAPDLGYKDQFAQAEQEAKENNRGLWGECSKSTNSTSDKPGLESAEDKDCKDFKTHAEAQAFFESAGPGDPHKLDGNRDGIACESLP